ncbi:MAG: transcriptional regulator NrdR [Christensenellales bacterium]|jgi:transcriptional repressor NrdR|nr:transcriptional repressor NrdR [Clostridiales bacterium]
MKCPFCNFEDSRVIDSRPTEDGASIRRRRECLGCSKRFTTYEKIELLPLLVVKKDQTRETFNAGKLYDGIIRACHKRPVPASEVEKIVSEIEQFAYNTMRQEISTKQIGEMVMERLKSLDEVAYIRFASVYRQFTDIPTFMKELNDLVKESSKTGKT